MDEHSSEYDVKAQYERNTDDSSAQTSMENEMIMTSGNYQRLPSSPAVTSLAWILSSCIRAASGSSHTSSHLGDSHRRIEELRVASVQPSMEDSNHGNLTSQVQ